MNYRLIILFLIFPFIASSQLHWYKVDSLYAPLPSSMHVYKTTDSLNGRPFIAYYVSAKLKDKKLLFTTQSGNGLRYTPQQYFKQEGKPLLVVNAGFFSFDFHQSLSVLVRNGKMVAYNIESLSGTGADSSFYYYPTRGAFGIARNRRADVAWVFTDSTRRWPYAFEWNPVVAKGLDQNPSIFNLNDINWKWWKMKTVVGGGPVLIHNGTIRITTIEEQLPIGENELRPATALGYTNDDRLIILVVQGRFPNLSEGISLKEEAKIMKDIGCYEALNMDGGGSSCMLLNGKETIGPSDNGNQRPVASVFLIKLDPEK
jgi:hypothetical protein